MRLEERLGGPLLLVTPRAQDAPIEVEPSAPDVAASPRGLDSGSWSGSDLVFAAPPLSPLHGPLAEICDQAAVEWREAEHAASRRPPDAEAASTARQLTRRVLLLQLLLDAPLRSAPAAEAEEALAGAPDASLDDRLLLAAVLKAAGRIEDQDEVLQGVIDQILADGDAPKTRRGTTEASAGEPQPSIAPAPVAAAPRPAAAAEEDLPEISSLFLAADEGETPAAASEGTGSGPPVHSSRDEAPFQIARLALAEEIRGLGDFTPLKRRRFRAGEALLVYGEFSGFRTAPRSVDASQGHVASFKASVRLLDWRNRVFNTSCFLKPPAGSSRIAAPGQNVNFWVRYRLPAEVQPGAYRLVVEAEDLEGKQEASAQIEVSVGGEPERPPPASTKSTVDSP
jgi:hypothetical protein